MGSAESENEESESADIDSNFGSDDVFNFGETSQSAGDTDNFSSNQSQSSVSFAEDYYSDNEDEDDSIDFTKDIALQVINNAIFIYDQKHSDAPIGAYLTSDEIERLAEAMCILMNS